MKPPSRRTIELLTLLQWPGVGPVRALRILSARRGGDWDWNQSVDTETIQHAARERAERILSTAASMDIGLISVEDESYPRLLRLIPDPPPILYVRGSLEFLNTAALAVVGTRSASRAGRSIASSIGRYLARHRYSVVSGLALGIDTEAHKGVLDEGGLTIAVLAHGLDTVSPASNRALADRILEARGALVSEHPPGTPPYRAEFVRRNRIQSGMSLGSIIVESGVKGGAIHQARFTSTQRRALFAVGLSAGQSDSDLDTSGAEYLVKTFGATMLRSIEELGRSVSQLVPRWLNGVPEEPEQAELDF